MGPAIGGGLQQVRTVFGGTCNGRGGGGSLQEARTVFGGTCNRGRSTRGEDGICWDLQLGGGLQEVRTVFGGTCNRGFPKPTHFWGVPLIVLNFRYDLVLS